MQWEQTKSQGLQSSRKQILITTLNIFDTIIHELAEAEMMYENPLSFQRTEE